jgi:AAA+ superfamily predicted ATPase
MGDQPQITNTITTNVPIQGQQNSNPYNYLDIVIGTQIVSQLSKMTSKNGINLTNVGILLATISLWEIKSGVKDVVQFVKNNYKPIFLGVYSGFRSGFSYLYNLRMQNKEIFMNHQLIYETVKYWKNVYELDVIKEFMGCLVYFLHMKHNEGITVEYTISNEKKIEIVNMDNNKITETYNNIVIKYGDIDIKIKNEIEIQYDNNKKNIVQFSTSVVEKNEKVELDNHKIKYVHELIDDPIIHFYLKSLFNHHVKENIISSDKLIVQKIDVIKDIDVIHKIDTSKTNYSIINENMYYYHNGLANHKVEYFILAVLKYHFPNLVLYVGLFETTYLMQMIYSTNPKSEIIINGKLQFFDLELDIPKELLDKINKYDNNIYKTIIRCYYTLRVYNYNNAKEYINLEINTYLTYTNTILYKSLQKHKINLPENNFKHVSCNVAIHINTLTVKHISTNKSVLGFNKDIDVVNTNTPSKKSLTFECHSLLNSEDQFYEFIKQVKDLSKIIHSSSSDVDVFRIQLTKQVNKTEIDCPKYLAWQELKSIFVNPENKQEKQIPNELWNIPDKTIIKETIEKKIEISKVNNGHKSFDTMYLKKNDEKKLLSVISKFHTKKEMLKSLGLPNKCCILFDGKPGTGKSSSILTIASYLKKNIYYMSFSNIETNSDLQLMFNHVITNCNGGIIVMEDIDAIGNFIHNRETHQIKEDCQNDELSLAYFLNLLQGTITPDGLIFIATTNHLNVLDPAFYRDGRFDVKITMTECDVYQLNKIYEKFIGRTIPDKYYDLLVSKKITPATFIFHVKDYMDDLDYTDEDILGKWIQPEFEFI